MLVNRYWKHFFSRALVEPEDDMRVTNPATNPELLDALATNFTDSGYDLKELVRTICNSQTYQLSAIPNAYNAGDRQNYSRYFPKRLSAEVLLDSIDHVTNSPTNFAGQLVGTRAVQLPDDSFNKSSLFPDGVWSAGDGQRLRVRARRRREPRADPAPAELEGDPGQVGRCRRDCGTVCGRPRKGGRGQAR